MENRCKRCNRELSDPNADYGWRCEEILGIDQSKYGLSYEYESALSDSITKTNNMMKGSNLKLSNINSKAFLNALLKQNFLNNIGRFDLGKNARKESFRILTAERINGYENSFDDWIREFSSDYNRKSGSTTARTLEFALTHPKIAIEIGPINSFMTNISSNSQRFADNSGLKENGDEGSGPKNAFRHVLWQATITKRYGIEIANEVGFAHEQNPGALGDKYLPEHFKDEEFENPLYADEVCDLLNNVQGRIVGVTTKESEMNKIAIEVLEKYHTDGFWVSKLTNNGKYIVLKEKLTDKQYKEIRNNLKMLDKNGYKNN